MFRFSAKNVLAVPFWLSVTLAYGLAAFGADTTREPSFEDYASIEARVDGEPVYCLDYMMYIYGISPDLIPGVVMQDGNTNPITKIKPKKTWEINWNYLLSNTEQVPRSRYNDNQPLLPIHLIDGDRDTVWCSFGSVGGPLQPSVADPEWIRIDLPVEATVNSISLLCSQNFYPGSNYGQSLPKELTIKLSTDAWHWETVYENKDMDVNETDRVDITFDPRPVKQIWIIGNHFTKHFTQGRPAFSIGEVEVLDPSGNNVALVSRGAGVTVSSTNFTNADNRLNQEALWAPLHYDMGMKWLRIGGAGNGAFQWPYVEHERGRLELDPVLDRWLTDAHRNGVNLILGLEPWVGNPIYLDPPRKTNWEEARWREFMLRGMDDAGIVDQSPEMLEGYVRFVEYMAGHLKDRAYIFQVGNEWGSVGWTVDHARRYMDLFALTYEAIKRAAPDARVMMGSVSPMVTDLILTCLGQEWISGVQDGHLMMSGTSSRSPDESLETSTLLTAEDVNARNVEVSIDALNYFGGEFGVLLRYKNSDHFLLAGVSYVGPGYGCWLYVVESPKQTAGAREGAEGNPPANLPPGWWTLAGTPENVTGAYSEDIVRTEGGLSRKKINLWGHNPRSIHLNARVEDSVLTLTLSDGKKEETITHEIRDEDLLEAGSVGLIQLKGANQIYDNFRVLGQDGKEIIAEDFNGKDGSLPDGWEYVYGPHSNPIDPGWGTKMDGIAWHWGDHTPAYHEAIRDLQRQCEALGFRGGYYATELVIAETLASALPALRTVVGLAGLGVVAGTQIIHFTGYAKNASNCHLTWTNQIATPVQPSPFYYMWRNLAGVTDDFHPADFPVTFNPSQGLSSFTFQRGENERMVAVWTNSDGETDEEPVSETDGDMILEGVQTNQAWAIDLLNGTEQELVCTPAGENTLIEGLKIKNYPTLLRFITNEG